MGVRWGGNSSITEKSRSPYSVSASVRGMGVAVITRTSGLIAFAHQLEALQHAEAMLLIHHHQAELRERHVLLDQRVRADDQVDRRPRRCRSLISAFSAALRALISNSTR